MAAGMGSRYGSLKQLDGIGPNGETILDYSIFDAQRSGFGKIVFVIRKSFEKEFQSRVVDKLVAGGIECACVFQELDILPEGFEKPAERTKPWGTAHAILVAENVVKEPFAAINSDDFYGRDAIHTIGKFLTNCDPNVNEYAMVGYNIIATLSPSGSVNRGVCTIDDDHNLLNINEHKNIAYHNDQLIGTDENGNEKTLSGKESVSMNLWGFTPAFFNFLKKGFNDFLQKNINIQNSEYYIPTAVMNLINSKSAHVKVLDSTSKWFGVTYKEDRKDVVAEIQKLVDEGVYPSKLF